MACCGRVLKVVICLTLACAAAPAFATGIALNSREYKVLLKPEQFTGSAEGHAAMLWEARLKPMIASQLDRRDNGDVRSIKSFSLKNQRRIAFKDTATCALSAVGFYYRERAKWPAEIGAEKTVESTLKLRGSEVFLINTSRFKGDSDAKAKFEEDISLASDGFAAKHNFAYSVSQKRAATAAPSELAAIDSAFPGTIAAISELSNAAPPADAALIGGKVFIELLYSGAKVDLGHGTVAEFDLAFWYPADAGSFDKPAIVELSFSYETDNGEVDRGIAQRGAKLAQGLTNALGLSIEIGARSKTSLALPNACREH